MSNSQSSKTLKHFNSLNGFSKVGLMSTKSKFVIVKVGRNINTPQKFKNGLKNGFPLSIYLYIRHIRN